MCSGTKMGQNQVAEPPQMLMKFWLQTGGGKKNLTILSVHSSEMCASYSDLYSLWLLKIDYFISFKSFSFTCTTDFVPSCPLDMFWAPPVSLVLLHTPCSGAELCCLKYLSFVVTFFLVFQVLMQITEVWFNCGASAQHL